MEHVQGLLELVTDKLNSVARSDVVVGQPIELGGVTIVPLSRISVGLGAGGGEGEGEFAQGGRKGEKKHRAHKGKGKGTGAGSGGGAKIRPAGVVVFSDEGIEVLPVPDRKGVLDKIFDKIPELVEMVHNAQKGKAAG